MVEEAWHTKMIISNMRVDKNETSRVENRCHKKELTEIPSRLSNLEASARRIAKDQRNQREKMEQLAGQFQLYLRYVHHMDITPANQFETPTYIRKMRMVEHKKESGARKEGDEIHPILLD
jgi:hypothetical protein